MRPALRVVRACAALGAAAWLLVPSAGPAQADDETVTVGSAQANTFSPKTVTIDKGDTVTWQYGGGTGHTVTSTSSNWDQNVAVGPPDGTTTLTTTHTFTKAGTYRYVCRTHESAGMRGTVIVRGATASPKPTKTPTKSPSPEPTVTSTGTPTRTSSTSPSASPTASPSGTPVASGSVPEQTPNTPRTPRPTGSVFIGEGGLGRQPPTGRDKGLPFLIALLLIGGVGSAELRALLANTPSY